MGSNSSARARACVCVCVRTCVRACICVCVSERTRDMHIIISVHVYESVMWFRVNVRISAGKALHFALADESFLLSTFPTYFEGIT